MEIYSVQWFLKHQGLKDEGVDSTRFNSNDVPVCEIEEYFGPRQGKNGFHYDSQPDPIVVAKIMELYRRVTGKEDVTNKLINVTFARAVVA